MSKTNIQISRKTRDVLASLGSKDDTYDDILRRVLKTVYDWDNVHKVSIPFQTRKGTSHMDVIIPRVASMNIDADEFTDAISALCEEQCIDILDDSEVAFHNDNF